MKRESRGEEQLVSCCGDGDVVDVGKGNAGGFGEGRKGEKAEGVGRHHGMQICKCVKKNTSKGLFSCRDSKINREKLSAACITRRLWKMLRWMADQLMWVLADGEQRQLKLVSLEPEWVLR